MKRQTVQIQMNGQYLEYLGMFVLLIAVNRCSSGVESENHLGLNKCLPRVRYNEAQIDARN